MINAALKTDEAEYRIIPPLRSGVRFRVEVDGDMTTITGAADDMHLHLDLSSMSYIESDGLIRAVIYDPIPCAGPQIANAALKAVRIGG